MTVFAHLILFLFIFLPVIHSDAESTRPNFIIVIADDVGWNDIGAYGNPHIRTPNIDAMARSGLLFKNAFLTTSSCSPSRASIMTGRYPHATGAAELHQPLAETAVTIPALLREAGYYAASVGKFHMGNIRSHFNRIEETRPSGCEKWVEVLRDRPQDKPFFLWFAGIDAHRAWSATTGKHAIAQPHTNDEVQVPTYIPDAPQVRRDIAQYYDEISRLDDYVGQVNDELERQGTLENTMVIFMSDNGRPFPRAKTTLYDDGLKTPFIVQWKNRIAAGTLCDSLVSSVDIAPSIIELAGLERPQSFQGKSFANLLANSKESIREYVYGEHNWHDYQAHERSVRSKEFLYIRNAFPELPGTPPADAVRSPTYAEMQQRHRDGTLRPVESQIFDVPQPVEALFDVIQDPDSLNNLAHDPKFADVLTTMRRQHEDWAKKTNDSVPEHPTPDKFDRETGTRLN